MRCSFIIFSALTYTNFAFGAIRAEDVLSSLQILPDSEEQLTEEIGFQVWILSQFGAPKTVQSEDLTQFNRQASMLLMNISKHFTLSEQIKKKKIQVSVAEIEGLKPLLLQVQVPKILHGKNIKVKWMSKFENVFSYDAKSKSFGINLFHESKDRFITLRSFPFVIRVKSSKKAEHLIETDIGSYNASFIDHLPPHSATFSMTPDSKGIASSTGADDYWNSVFILYTPLGIFTDKSAPALSGNYQGHYEVSFELS